MMTREEVVALYEQSKKDVLISPQMWRQMVETLLSVEDPAELLMARCHGAAAKAGWWADLETGESLIGKKNVPELLMLIVSELGEAMEGHRKNLMDDKLPHRKMVEVELADAVIRIFDMAGGMGYDLAGAIEEKLRYNETRADHKPENRAQAGGKAY
jgi:NTP pyrophosphatase (non-canonical NTP hydrolase)